MATYNINKIITPSGDVCNLSTSGNNIWYGTSSYDGSSTVTVTTTTGDFSLVTGNLVIVRLGQSGGNPESFPLSSQVNIDSTGAKSISGVSLTAYASKDFILEYNGSTYTLVDFLDYQTTPGRGLSYQNTDHLSRVQTLANESPAWYCTCTTGTGTAAKVLTSLNGNYTNPTDGDIITVRFTEADAGPTQTTTLNIDSSGAYEMNRGNLQGPIWGNGGHQTFVFKGSKWYTVDIHQALSGILGVVMLSNSADSSLGTSDGYAATPKAVADAQTASRVMDAGAGIGFRLDTDEIVTIRRTGSSGSYAFGLAYSSDGGSTSTALGSLVTASGEKNWISPSDQGIDFQATTSKNTTAWGTSVGSKGTISLKAGYYYTVVATAYLTPASGTTAALLGFGDTSTTTRDGESVRKTWSSVTTNNAIRFQCTANIANTGSSNKTIYILGQAVGAACSASTTYVSYIGYKIAN